MTLKTLRFAFLTLALAGCISPTRTPFPTESPTPSLTPSPTIVWFPPTRTPTVIPTLEPQATEDLRVDLGDVLLEDKFDDATLWSLASSNAGSAAVSNSHLTIAIRQPKTLLLTTRLEPVFGDFYVEVTAEASLCSGLDEFGLLLRVTPSLEYYRFGVSCNGQARVDRIYRGTVSTMAPWTRNGAVPSSAPSVVRLGVWARGQEVRFFVNGIYLFTVQDTLFFQGTLGLFARSAGENALTVNFSDLTVHQVLR